MQSILTKTFGEELRAALKAAHVRQNTLARHLNMTPSAISQTISGVLVPSRERLDQIVALLEGKADVVRLRRLWQRIRLGESEVHSAANKELLERRRKRHLSVVTLANLSGISAARIRELESDPGALPSAEEAEKLSGILKCDLGGYATSDGDADVRYTPVVTPILEVADRAMDLPLLSAEMLMHYRDGEPLADFAAGHALENVRCGVLNRGAVCAVVLDAGMMKINVPGKLRVFLSEGFFGELSALTLALTEKGLFFLPSSPSASAEKTYWRLPVTEVVFHPGKNFL